MSKVPNGFLIVFAISKYIYVLPLNLVLSTDNNISANIVAQTSNQGKFGAMAVNYYNGAVYAVAFDPSLSLPVITRIYLHGNIILTPPVIYGAAGASG